jgi:hypothetical protein
MPHNPLSPRGLRMSLVTSLVALAAFASTSPAMADEEIVASTTAASQLECQDPVFSQPFSDLKDDRDYVLAPGGDFSDPSGGGWQFSGGARIADDTRPDGTTGGSLYMRSGSTAVSPVMCVDITYPTARLWAQKLGGDGDVRVSVSYAGTATEHKPKEVGHVHGDDRRWKLSGDIHIKPELAGNEHGWRRVAFVFVAGGNNGQFEIDDLYVDPRMSR